MHILLSIHFAIHYKLQREVRICGDWCAVLEKVDALRRGAIAVQ